MHVCVRFSTKYHQSFPESIMHFSKKNLLFDWVKVNNNNQLNMIYHTQSTVRLIGWLKTEQLWDIALGILKMFYAVKINWESICSLIELYVGSVNVSHCMFAIMNFRSFFFLLNRWMRMEYWCAWIFRFDFHIPFRKQTG